MVVHNSDLVVDQRVDVIESSGVLELQQCSFQVVHPQILHADIKTSLVTPREEATGCSVGCHCWVGFVLSRESMAKSNPPWGEVPVQLVALVEVFTRQVVLLNQEVVSAHREPGNRTVSIVADQAMCGVVKFADFAQFNEDCAVQGNY